MKQMKQATQSQDGTLSTKRKSQEPGAKRRNIILAFLTEKRLSARASLEALSSALSNMPQETKEAMAGQVKYWEHYVSTLNDLIRIAGSKTTEDKFLTE